VLSLVGRPLLSRTRPVEPPPRNEIVVYPLVDKNLHAGEAHARLAVAETPRRTGPTPGASRSPHTGALKGSSLQVRMPQVDVTRALRRHLMAGATRMLCGSLIRAAAHSLEPRSSCSSARRTAPCSTSHWEPAPIPGPTPSPCRPSRQPWSTFGSAWSRPTLGSTSL